MSPADGAPVRLRHGSSKESAYEPFAADVLAGLREHPKRISPIYFYDARGSQLFDQICELKEYYPTRTEMRILADDGDDMASYIGEDALLVELGSGSSMKTRLLLDRLPTLAAYVPVDISRSHLLNAAHGIAAAYPRLEVLPVCADFTQPFALPKAHRRAKRVVVFFPGSTIGNFDPPQALGLLRVMRDIAGAGGGLLIGTDLVKDPGMLVRAYDDARGVTAAFNLNVLRRFNHELRAGFDLQSFQHRAVWNAAASRIEMHLVSTRAQRATLAGEVIELAAGEAIVTEHCHKYTVAGFAAQAARAGWSHIQHWLDPHGWFSVNYLEA
ncbi:MAG TPA: L-histidine N(alpha)-methyltransferase [Steroidobacteraceae bacterium]|jgi:L-histidine N-alpha-methyltransferase|nr:L-histidine N(alpha)-methyltransferase [Steroidobacteraceae bacterium]